MCLAQDFIEDIGEENYYNFFCRSEEPCVTKKSKKSGRFLTDVDQ